MIIKVFIMNKPIILKRIHLARSPNFIGELCISPSCRPARDSLAVLHGPCATFFVQMAMLISESSFHDHSHLAVESHPKSWVDGGGGGSTVALLTV
jgi:hypothetical protein